MSFHQPGQETRWDILHKEQSTRGHGGLVEVTRDGGRWRSVGRKDVDGTVGGKSGLVNVHSVPTLQTLLDSLLCHWKKTFVKITIHSANLFFFLCSFSKRIYWLQ